MPTLHFTVGLPGSGKSTLFEELHKKNPNSVRVNRDLMREEIAGVEYHNGAPIPEVEKKVSQLWESRIKTALKEGKDVYNDDTNMNIRTVRTLAQIARSARANITPTYVDVPIEVAKERNRLRGANGGRLVPDYVIDNMASKNIDCVTGKIAKYSIDSHGNVTQAPVRTQGEMAMAQGNAILSSQHPFKGKAAVLVDVDGTLAANSKDVDTYLSVPGKKEYDKFFYSIKDAPVNKDVVNLVNKMRDEDDISIVILTGRSDIAANELMSFILRSGIKASRAIAKKQSDNRKSDVYKLEELKKLKREGFIPVHAIDDRPHDLEMWKQQGLTVTEMEYFDIDPQRKEYPTPKFTTIYGTGACLRCGKPISKGNIGPVCLTKEFITRR